jgi:hypothetical protein
MKSKNKASSSYTLHTIHYCPNISRNHTYFPRPQEGFFSGWRGGSVSRGQTLKLFMRTRNVKSGFGKYWDNNVLCEVYMNTKLSLSAETVLHKYVHTCMELLYGECWPKKLLFN